ncbi:SH3 domain-containing YSC84-like protein 1 [Physocladia obscura]|uniref:SH3 domain-containing YSC84-like protein 1 n=1 Tax=Physocladia obscura TaxID=109957 RepID=A0AAD5T4W3_9FUNG|nr:SH3 domain-containing YSC84-like protein 1 [Physocladia obscura]
MTTDKFSQQCQKAAHIMQGFFYPEVGKLDRAQALIPQNIISQAKGVAILQVTRVGFHVSGRYGTGVVVARLADGTWSPPSVVKTAGIGLGFVFGAEVTDRVFVLNTDDAVNAFCSGQVTLGGNLSVAAGLVGRTAEAGISLGSKNAVPIFTYSKTQGLLFGASFEGSVVTEGKKENAAFYGSDVSVKEILHGFIPRPQVAADLYAVLERRVSFEKTKDTEPSITGLSAPPFIIPTFKPSATTNPPSYEEFAVLSEDDYHKIVTDAIITPVSVQPSASPSSRPLPTAPGSTTNNQEGYCVALHDYTSEEPGDLKFKVGDRIRVTKKNADGWWYGVLEKSKGSFPSNFVRLV